MAIPSTPKPVHPASSDEFLACAFAYLKSPPGQGGFFPNSYEGKQHP
jgi:hypothetical protein